MTTTDPPEWAMRLARTACLKHPKLVGVYCEPCVAIARAIADAVDAARVEAAEVAEDTGYTGGAKHILALRGKDPGTGRALRGQP